MGGSTWVQENVERMQSSLLPPLLYLIRDDRPSGYLSLRSQPTPERQAACIRQCTVHGGSRTVPIKVERKRQRRCVCVCVVYPPGASPVTTREFRSGRGGVWNLVRGGGDTTWIVESEWKHSRCSKLLWPRTLVELMLRPKGTD